MKFAITSKLIKRLIKSLWLLSTTINHNYRVANNLYMMAAQQRTANKLDEIQAHNLRGLEEFPILV